ncbi:hypothetical protein EUGRSUZ_A00712 [Eucalyptus grandis]|uniref:Uncharacterized protein n=2 Tax=Eucalyptus grandis TaxID=71139 RepID=A0ACC3M1G6_EUCGR|nr:hypothetical protein EUGRSUZ_A00712 [Eucalyptus grandis]
MICFPLKCSLFVSHRHTKIENFGEIKQKFVNKTYKCYKIGKMISQIGITSPLQQARETLVVRAMAKRSGVDTNHVTAKQTSRASCDDIVTVQNP